MRAMPSPTSSTRPTSRVSICERYCSISLVRTETISSALNLMTTSRDELVPDNVKLRADRGVVDPVAYLHHQSAQKIGIDPRFQNGFQTKRLVQFLLKAFTLIVRQGERRGNLHTDAPGAF